MSLPEETSPYLLLGAQGPMAGRGARSASLWVHTNLSGRLSWDGNLLGSGTSHATTASQKPSFRVPWRVGDAVVSRENTGWTTAKSGHP